MIIFRPDPRDLKLIIGMDEKGMKMFHEAMKKRVEEYYSRLNDSNNGKEV